MVECNNKRGRDKDPTQEWALNKKSGSLGLSAIWTTFTGHETTPPKFPTTPIS